MIDVLLIVLAALTYAIWKACEQPRSGADWYAVELRTPAWRLLSLLVQMQAGYACSFCDGRSSQSHHCCYVRGLPPWHPYYLQAQLLVPACARCHARQPRNRVIVVLGIRPVSQEWAASYYAGMIRDLEERRVYA